MHGNMLNQSKVTQAPAEHSGEGNTDSPLLTLDTEMKKTLARTDTG